MQLIKNESKIINFGQFFIHLWWVIEWLWEGIISKRHLDQTNLASWHLQSNISLHWAKLSKSLWRRPKKILSVFIKSWFPRVNITWGQDNKNYKYYKYSLRKRKEKEADLHSFHCWCELTLRHYTPLKNYFCPENLKLF